MANRIWNFNAGPATLPLPVLEKAKEDLPDYAGSGMAVMELSHRSKEYSAIHEEAMALMRELLSVPENFKILFLQGGASMQFAQAPMNILKETQSADYIITGAWSKKAFKEATMHQGEVRVAGSSEDTNFNRVPTQKELDLDPNAVYCHLTSNNTIAGTQFPEFPNTGTVPLVSDMSSDILSRPIDFHKFGLVYAGAQKNLGPSGVTIVIAREDFVEGGRDDIPIIMQYRTHADKDSLYNTPPTYSIYLVKLVLEWVKELGGMEVMQKRNEDKAALLYDAIKGMSKFYRCAAEKGSRSLMNVCFRLPTTELESQFVSEALAAGFGGLKGHRSVGGIRASIYNNMEPEGVKQLTEFMKEFAKKNG
jgi:phosphoserine aminotransferase